MPKNHSVLDFVHPAAVSGKEQFSFNEAKDIGDALGIHWDKFDVEQFRMGLNIEREHGRGDPKILPDMPLVAGETAMAHLNDISDYYTQLAVMTCSSLRAFHSFRFLLR